jgi:UDP-glucose 4-epimerase
MRVLVTGNRGLIGRYVETALCDAGHQVIGFDIRDGCDIRNCAAVSGAAAGCEAIVHLAAFLPPGNEKNASEVMAVNLLGTWNVLLAAKEHRVGRVIYFSSVNALGIFMGDRKPDYLPIDDYHPCYPRSPYSVSKRLAEEMCRFHTEETGAVTVCLRPPLVLGPDDYHVLRNRWKEDPESEWLPFWEYGAFLDVRDAASAALAALTRPSSGHTSLLLCADDSMSSEPIEGMAGRLLPDVPYEAAKKGNVDPCHPLISTALAKKLLQWAPRHRWHSQIAG